MSIPDPDKDDLTQDALSEMATAVLDRLPASMKGGGLKISDVIEEKSEREQLYKEPLDKQWSILDGYFRAVRQSPAHLARIAEKQRLANPDADRGGRKSGYNLPSHLNRFEMTKCFVEEYAKTGKYTEAARCVIRKFNWGKDENGDIPTNDVLNTRVKLFRRWQKEFGL